jgi:hypothetical protein
MRRSKTAWRMVLTLNGWRQLERRCFSGPRRAPHLHRSVDAFVTSWSQFK